MLIESVSLVKERTKQAKNKNNIKRFFTLIELESKTKDVTRKTNKPTLNAISSEVLVNSEGIINCQTIRATQYITKGNNMLFLLHFNLLLKKRFFILKFQSRPRHH